MTKADTIGIDIAKNVFHLHAAAANGAVVFQRKLPRGRLLDFLTGQAPSLVAMEACARCASLGPCGRGALVMRCG